MNPCTYAQVLEQMVHGKSHMLILGRGGSGKTRLIQKFINSSDITLITAGGYPVRVVQPARVLGTTLVVAPTGMAAHHISGQTIHSAFQFKASLVTEEDALEDSRCTEILKNITTLVIDEVSMLRADVFSGIDMRLKSARDSTASFGGVRLILVGDPYQLEPVVDPDDEVFLQELTGIQQPGFYFFQARCFNDSDFQKKLAIYSLEGAFRHRDDPEFSNLLDRVRVGEQTDGDIRTILRCYQPFAGTKYQTLCTTNESVEKTNHFAKMTLKVRPLVSKPHIAPQTAANLRVVRDHSANREVELYKGGRVLITKNDPSKGYFNGSTGTITTIETSDAGIPFLICVQLDSGAVVEIGRETFPIFRPYWKDEARSNGIRIEQAATVSNFPLMSSYGMTIHRAQGMTIDKVAINFGNDAFAYGQAYVALSRVRRLDTLVLVSSRFAHSDIKVSPEVRSFMASISGQVVPVQ